MQVAKEPRVFALDHLLSICATVVSFLKAVAGSSRFFVVSPAVTAMMQRNSLQKQRRGVTWSLASERPKKQAKQEKKINSPLFNMSPCAFGNPVLHCNWFLHPTSKHLNQVLGIEKLRAIVNSRFLAILSCYKMIRKSEFFLYLADFNNLLYDAKYQQIEQ